MPQTQFVGGSFFKPATIPKAEPGMRNVYVLRVVLHDWNDSKTCEILSNVRSAMGDPSLPFNLFSQTHLNSSFSFTCACMCMLPISIAC